MSGCKPPCPLQEAGVVRGDTPPRVHAVDELRGLCVVLMIAYHAAVSLNLHGLLSAAILYHPLLMVLQPIFAGIFIAICGFASVYARSNLRRGLKLFVLALAVSLITWLVDMPIWFGILHFLSLSMLIYAGINRWIDKVPAIIGLVAYLILFILTRSWVASVGIVENAWLFPFGFRGRGFYSADYFPLLPWIFVFFIGTILGRLVQRKNRPPWIFRERFAILSWIGRRALLAYLVHQPIIFGILWVITR